MVDGQERITRVYDVSRMAAARQRSVRWKFACADSPTVNAKFD